MLKNVLQMLVIKLELLEKDSYIKVRHGDVFRYWQTELQEAKKALEESNKTPVNLCTGYTTRDIDLFDNRQPDLPLKHEDDL